MPLGKYRSKRSADRTPEPFGGAVSAHSSQTRGIFVVQKHAARRLHYDFRLEMEGVLRSWAVPKGPSLNPADKHLAVAVEDHPLEYGDFEGVIPEGNYGAGAVIVWDRGEWSAQDFHGNAADAIRAGKLDIVLRGFKLNGAYTLVRTGARRADPEHEKNWLLIKKRDEFARADDVFEAHPRSVLSGLTIEELRDAPAAGRKAAAYLARQHLGEFSRPLRRADFPLMLAKLGDKPFDSDKWLYELKYDGVRVLAIRDAGAIQLFARSGTDITNRYPEVVLALKAHPFDRFAIDGEVVAVNDHGRPDFQLLQTRMHVNDKRRIARLSYAVPVRYFVFDILAFDRYDARTLPLEKRKQLLSELIMGDGPVRYCDHVVARGTDFYHAVAEHQLEGMIAKLRSSPYRGARSGDWLKIKCPLIRNFVIGGYTDPGGTRTHFGALLLGQYEQDGALRFTDKAGTGFNRDLLRKLHAMLLERAQSNSPFRKAQFNEPSPAKDAHFVRPELVGKIKFSEWTDHGGVRQPSFLELAENADPRQCLYEGPNGLSNRATEPIVSIEELDTSGRNGKIEKPVASVTHPEKVFWPEQGYTKGDLVAYYRLIAKWMLPYLADRPVMLTRFPDGIEGKMFYQKDAPAFVPSWIRTAKIYAEDSQREIAYFILDNEEAIAYVANLAAITIHIWSSRVTSLEHPDWLLFDIDPKGSTTRAAFRVAQEVARVLREVGLEPCLKTSGQMGLHVVVGLAPKYTYEQAKMFSELVAQTVVNRIPKIATINRNPGSRQGRVYIDYLQLGHGKTIAAPFSVRPVPGAAVSAPMRWTELHSTLDPSSYNIKNMAARMNRLKRDPFVDVLTKKAILEEPTHRLEPMLAHPGRRNRS
ncbi:MAG: DNA ligase D [Candidatus Binataceae bacterium]|nr:DNA ligase D [Candidatus Binataceae bacterium]